MMSNPSLIWACSVAATIGAIAFAGPATAANLRVMNVGLGSASGSVSSMPTGINCGSTCDFNFPSGTSVTLTASATVQWHGDCTTASTTCPLTMNGDKSVRAEFSLSPAINPITDFTPEGIETYLANHANDAVNTPGRFVAALPDEFKQNWIMMSRSESLQAGTAHTPRFLLPNFNGTAVFTVTLDTDNSYPGGHPNAIEYMQWDATQKTFRFHEIVLAHINAMGRFPVRERSISKDEVRCSRCHSTRNVLNRGTTPGTDGLTPRTISVKNKPNWEAYDSWAGMLPFNRDKIYQGSVEAAAFRRILNLWNWRNDNRAREFIEQLALQPPMTPANHDIHRLEGGANDGYIVFFFDSSPPVVTEPPPDGGSTREINYSFDGGPGIPPGTLVQQGGLYVTLHHTSPETSSDPQGRAVNLFDALGGQAHLFLNQIRVGNEVATHRYATGSVLIDPRPIALAITKCLSTDDMGNISPATLAVDRGFFDARNGKTLRGVIDDTREREQSLPRRKADNEATNLDRSSDVYLLDGGRDAGVSQEYGGATSLWTDGSLTRLDRLRQEVFRRPTTGFPADRVIGGIYVDREKYFVNTNKVALYRYFLEPLGISVDKWSMGVRGRSRTYTFADVFEDYTTPLTNELEANLSDAGYPGLSAPYSCTDLITAVNNQLITAKLPASGAVPTYTDLQRIFNKSCIECHGGLGYPPFVDFFPADYLDLTEDENPTPPDRRLTRSHTYAMMFTSSTLDPNTNTILRRITADGEHCGDFVSIMPCGGPRLSQTDIETFKRWITGGRPSTEGDPHLVTMDGTPYDFQAAGEFVLLRGEDLEIQTRQTAVATDGPLGPNDHTGLTSCVSLNSAVAIRVGRHRVTYEPHLSGRPDPAGLQLRVDGQLVQMSPRGINLPSGGRILPTPARGGIQIEYTGGTDIVVTPSFWDYYQVWYLNVDVRHARATEGVMGTIAPGEWLPVLPDGTSLGARPADLQQRYQDLYVKFANAWRVTDPTSLFDYAPGTSTSTFTDASWPLEQGGEFPPPCRPKLRLGIPDKPPLKRLPLETAKQRCAGLVDANRRANCEQDVMVTGEPAFAATYLATEKIERNSIPKGTSLLYPEDNQIHVPTKVTFRWKPTSDADGGKLTYQQCVWIAGDPVTFNNCREVSPSIGASGGVIFYVWFALLLILLLLLLFLYVRMKHHRRLLGGLILVVLLLAFLFFRWSGADTMSTTVAGLKPRKAYFWKVVVNDGQGGTAESAMWRFATD